MATYRFHAHVHTSGDPSVLKHFRFAATLRFFRHFSKPICKRMRFAIGAKPSIGPYFDEGYLHFLR